MRGAWACEGVADFPDEVLYSTCGRKPNYVFEHLAGTAVFLRIFNADCGRASTAALHPGVYWLFHLRLFATGPESRRRTAGDREVGG